MAFLENIQLALTEQTDTNEISLTDPEARLMKTRTGIDVCYNAQISVDDMVCTSLKWHNIVSVCIFVLIYKWGGRSRREGFLNLLAVPEVMH